MVRVFFRIALSAIRLAKNRGCLRKSEVWVGADPIGYLMPKVDPHATVTLDAYFHEKLAEINNLDPESLSLTRRLDVAISLCGFVADLHSKKIYCIDFNPKAILANRGFGLVTFLDCDGYSFVAKNSILQLCIQITKGLRRTRNIKTR